MNDDSADRLIADLLLIIKVASSAAIILLVALALASISTSAYDVNDTTTINESQLPYSSYFNLSLTLANNYTAFLNQTNISNNTQLIFPPSVYFNNTNNTVVEVNYTITDFPVTANTTLQAEITISNDLNNLTFTYGLILDIIDDETTITIIGENNLTIITGGYNQTISTNFLPSGGEFKFELTGQPGTQVNATNCEEWLICPTNNVTLDSAGKAIIEINYLIPQNTSTGEYNRTITFNNGDTNKTGTIIFNIVDPTVIIESFIWEDSCFEGTTDEEIKQNLISCLNDYEKFAAKRFADAITGYLDNENATCEPNTITEYLVVGEVGEGVIEELNTCRDERTTFSENYQETSTNYNTCQKDLDSCQQELNDGIGRLQNKAIAQTEQLKKEQEDALASQSTAFWSWLTFFTLIALSCLGLNRLWKNWKLMNYGGKT